jgi:hypothetical protein
MITQITLFTLNHFLLKTELTAVASFDGKRVIAVGLNGIVLTSSNAGKISIIQILLRLLSPEPQVVYVLFNECL